MSSAFPRSMGCVGSLPATRHPISAARAVLLAAVAGPNDFGLQPPMQVVGRSAKAYAEKAAERVRVNLLRNVHEGTPSNAPEWTRYASLSPPDPLELAREDDLSTPASRAVRSKYLRQMALRVGLRSHQGGHAIARAPARRGLPFTAPPGPAGGRKRIRSTSVSPSPKTTVVLPPLKRRRVDFHSPDLETRSRSRSRSARASGGDQDDDVDDDEDAEGSCSTASSTNASSSSALSPSPSSLPSSSSSSLSSSSTPTPFRRPAMSPAGTPVPIPCAALFPFADDDIGDDVINDTVGVTVTDRNGIVSAGVSSGGMILKHAGRTGSGGIPGAGCWAERRSFPGIGSKWTVGCTASGRGEHLIAGDVARSVARGLHSEATIRRLHACMSGIAWEQADAGVGGLEAGVSALAVCSQDDTAAGTSAPRVPILPNCATASPTPKIQCATASRTTAGAATCSGLMETCLLRPRARVVRGSLVTSVGLGNIPLLGTGPSMNPPSWMVRIGTSFTTRHFAVAAAVDSNAVTPETRKALCEQIMPPAIKWTEDRTTQTVACAGVLTREDVLRTIRPC